MAPYSGATGGGLVGPEDAASLGVPLTNLDDPLFDGAGATKRDLINYLDVVADRIIPVLADRPLSVIRVHRGQEAFMQKNLPSYTPAWVSRVTMWAESSKRDVTYALCNDRRSLLWFGNQRAVEYHPALIRVDDPEHMTHLVLDIDPPRPDAFADAVRAARVVRQVLVDEGLGAVIKTSGAKGLHIFVPIDSSVSIDAAAAATRAIAARAERLDPDTVTSAFMKEDRGGRCSSIRPALAERRSRPRTARGCGPAHQCPFRWTGTSWMTSRRRTSRSSPPRVTWAIATYGRLRCRSHRGSARSWLRKAEPSRSRVSRPCMRGSAGRDESSTEPSPIIPE